MCKRGITGACDFCLLNLQPSKHSCIVFRLRGLGSAPAEGGEWLHSLLAAGEVVQSPWPFCLCHNIRAVRRDAAPEFWATLVTELGNQMNVGDQPTTLPVGLFDLQTRTHRG